MKPFNPQSTTFTNIMLDKIMPSVSPNAWKILCLSMRKTAGWQDLSTQSGRKETDIISISQFREGCGIGSNSTVEDAIKECVNAGYLIQERDGKSFRYRLNVDYEIPDDSITDSVNDTITDSVKDTITESVKTNNKTINTNIYTREEKIKEGNKQALERSLANKKTPNLGDYPEDTWPVLEKLSDLWKIALPPKKSSQYGYWVRGSRELIEVCEGHPEVVIEEIHRDQRRQRNKMTISSPYSLVNMARAKVGDLKVKVEEANNPFIPQASEVWIGGVKF